MKSGKKSTKFQAKRLIFALLMVAVFIYANVTATAESHKSETTLLPDKKFLPAILKDIDNASESVTMAIYMFKTSDRRRNDSELIKKALIRASKRGVNVLVVMDLAKKKDLTTKFNTDTGEELENAGINVKYDNIKRRMHSKCTVIDSKISYIGSHNYTHSALKYNSELTVRIVSNDIAEETEEYIRSIK